MCLSWCVLTSAWTWGVSHERNKSLKLLPPTGKAVLLLHWLFGVVTHLLTIVSSGCLILCSLLVSCECRAGKVVASRSFVPHCCFEFDYPSTLFPLCFESRALGSLENDMANSPSADPVAKFVHDFRFKHVCRGSDKWKVQSTFKSVDQKGDNAAVARENWFACELDHRSCCSRVLPSLLVGSEYFVLLPLKTKWGSDHSLLTLECFLIACRSPSGTSGVAGVNGHSSRLTF